MKEATGELNMTLVTILAVAAILAFVTFFVPKILKSIENNWGKEDPIYKPMIVIK
ncbi:MAG: hypothetical protein RR359_01345 [Bacilli bacterium]